MSQPPTPPSPSNFWRNPTVLGVAAVVGAIAAVFAIPALNAGSSPAASSSSQGPVTVGGNVGGCIQAGSTNPQCTIQQQADEATKNSADAQHLKDLVHSFSEGAPQGPAPWSFLVYNTKDQTGAEVGLKVKAQPIAAGMQIGSARGRSLVWAECYVMNTYDPEKGSDVDVGPKWLRITWPTEGHSTGFSESSPEDRFRGYVYAGYALPFNHNGSIPACPS